MKKIIFLISILCFSNSFSQEKDTTSVYKKRVLETAEIEFLGSYYNQDGKHSAVGGGIGTEELKDYTSNIVLSIPMNDDDVLTIDAGFSAYTSASSSNINPFMTDASFTNSTGASSRYYGKNKAKKDDDDDDGEGNVTYSPYGSPWIASTGASKKDVFTSVTANYSHSSDNRNTVWNVDASVSNEFDYQSFGFGGGLAKLFNDKNTEISIKANAYLDKWSPIYPTELHEYAKYGINFQQNGYFENVPILNQSGVESTNYLPSSFTEFNDNKRNSYSVSLGFSQVLTKRLQMSLFMDLLYQEGLLSTPYHRIYFADKANYYIGQTRYIPVYETSGNTGVFRLADDVERLPSTRFKIPIGARVSYYLNEKMVVRSYYRFYTDDWGLQAHTINIELPYKLSDYFTVYPMYRFYTQKAARYFAPFEKHYSFEKYYTSDYDLSSFDSHQYGFGLSYTDILTSSRIWKFGLKSIDFRYNHYERNDALRADIFSLGIKFVQ